MRLQDALDRKGEDVERPPLVPTGTYRWAVSKMPSMDTIANGRFEVIDFQLKCLEAQDDVDPDELAEYTAKSGDVNGVVRRHRFLFSTEDEGNFNRTLYNLKRFLSETLGIEGVEDNELKVSLAEAVNQQLLASVRWRPDPNDPQIMYDEIDRTAPAN